MVVTETLSEGLKREYNVSVSADDLEGRLTGRLVEIGQEAQLPGFRRGKVPMSLLRRTYGQKLLSEILEQTVNETTSQAIKDNDLRPAVQPKIEVIKFEEGEDLEFKVEVEILPNFDPVDFSKLEVERPVLDVSDEHVDERIEQIGKQYREYIDAADKEKAKEGDTVVVDFVGSIDGNEFDGGKAEEYNLELGSQSFIPGFEEQLIGTKKNQEIVVKVKFPDDYGNADIKGKDAEFSVKIQAIKVPLPVVIDDKMAEKLGLENLDALKKAVREQVEKEFGQLSRERLKRALLDILAAGHTFEVPPTMLEYEFGQIWEKVKDDLQRQGKTIDDLDKSEAEAEQEYREIAERRVRLGLLLSEVGRQNNIDVTQEEVNRVIAQQARQFAGQEKEVMEFYRGNPEMLAQLQAPILEDKVIDFIIEMAKVEDKPVSMEELLNEATNDDEQ